MNVLSILKITNIIVIFMVTRNLSCIMMMILNLIDRRGGFVEYLLVINHPFSSQNYHIRHCPHNRIEVVLQYCFSRSRTYKYNNMSYHDHEMFYFYCKSYSSYERCFWFFDYVCNSIQTTWQRIQISYSK